MVVALPVMVHAVLAAAAGLSANHHRLAKDQSMALQKWLAGVVSNFSVHIASCVDFQLNACLLQETAVYMDKCASAASESADFSTCHTARPSATQPVHRCDCCTRRCSCCSALPVAVSMCTCEQQVRASPQQQGSGSHAAVRRRAINAGRGSARCLERICVRS